MHFSQNEAMVLSQSTSAAQRMQSDGFVILDQLFTPLEIAPISDEIDRIIRGEADYLPAKEVINEPNTNPPQVRNAFRLHFYNPLFLDFAKSRKMIDPLEDILGKPLRLYGSSVFAKPARVGSVVPAHQDLPYWPFEPPELISAWVALDDSTIENGCVRFAVGSHKLGLLPHETTSITGNSLGLLPNPKVDALSEHAVEVKRGSVVLHHSLAVHRSEPNQSDQPRRGLIYVYMSPNVRLTDASKLKGPAEFTTVS